MKLALQNELRKNSIEVFDASNVEEIQDRCTISFYPERIEITEETFKQLKQKKIDEFFSFSDQVVPGTTLYHGLRLFNLKETFVDCTDERLLTAFKRQWKRQIDKEKARFLQKLTQIDTSEFSEEEKAEFASEVSILSDEIEANINDNLKKTNTLKEIISYWPKHLQPCPPYVFDEK